MSLSACGGGGGGGGGGAGAYIPAQTTAAASTPGVKTEGSNAVKASCVGCAAVNDSTYAGSGTGVWQAANGSSVPVDMPLSISGLNGQTVTLVFTNESTAAEALPGLVVRSSSEIAATANKAVVEQPIDEDDAAKDAIREFNRSGFAKLLDPLSKASPSLLKSMAPSAAYAVADQRNIFLYDRTQRTVQLAAQRATADGTTVNLWVETGELDPTRVSSALAARMLDKFAAPGGIYDMLVRVGGPLWGEHGMSQLIAGSGQPLDIFIVNFKPDHQPYGLVGYFWGLNNFKAGSGDLALSNESLSLYLDSESLYLDGENGIKQIATVMAHEGMHMQNFYRRGVKMGPDYSFDTWLEEMSALMMEDWASFNIDPSHNAIRDSRYPYYLSYNGAGSYNCGLTEWTPMGASCESYAVTGSFGGFLNRQLGLDFYKALLASAGVKDSTAILDQAIKSRRPDSGIGQELRRFAAASAGLIPLGAGIADYSMPARSEDVFSLPAIDPASFGAGKRKLPQSAPSLLEALASFPVIRPNVAGTYNETVRVPPGSTLSVIIN
ncbi:Peptidase M30 [Variovorax sp. HW608]|uniref:M30 family zinc metallopeptidase n=1 Tax=Variovorax sp. HW608 TaxID=1034889 RepID=UPI0008200297|nr:hemagglutinin [Variovorax sp. HW608]SCK59989.1 Peptidase M30 [Variovorax sp. HW608]